MSSLTVLFVMLMSVLHTEGICSSEAYDAYLEAYPVKCGLDCTEYKE